MTHTPELSIGERPVGGDHPTYVIAEVGANHNRDLDTAHRLIDVAVEAGADAVKFQTYSGNRIYSSKTPKFKYLEGISDKSPAELLEEISLPREWQGALNDYSRRARHPVLLIPVRPRGRGRARRARRPGAEDRLVRDRRPAADPRLRPRPAGRC